MGSPPPRRIFVSSPAIDLPEHRRQVFAASRRLRHTPEGPEHWTEGITPETLAMIDRADLFIGIYGYRYGVIPDGPSLASIEAEYDLAGARGIPRLAFVMADDHPVLPRDVDTGPGAAKLQAFKARIESAGPVYRFSGVDDLRVQFSGLLRTFRAESTVPVNRPREAPIAPLPALGNACPVPEPAHLIGRERELDLLTDWVSQPASVTHGHPLFGLIGVDGIGKTAIARHFFERVAPLEMRPLAGRLWWDLRDEAGGLDPFVAYALAYCAHIPPAEISRLEPQARRDWLLQTLDGHPFLLVLDGLDALLDQPRLPGGDQGVAAAPCSDPRTAAFLRRLTRLRASRVLFCSDCCPTELCGDDGMPVAGITVSILHGLEPAHALGLWRAYGVTGARDEMQPLFASVDRDPLSIQVLATAVAAGRPAAGDFLAWRRAHAGFDPVALPAAQRAAHLIAFALCDLHPDSLAILEQMAAHPVTLAVDTLSALLGQDGTEPEAGLRMALTDLTRRGLAQRIEGGERYRLHPVVARRVNAGLGAWQRRRRLENWLAFLRTRGVDGDGVDTDDADGFALASALYDTLIGVGRHAQAFALLTADLHGSSTWRRLGVTEQLAMVRALFPEGERELPPLPSAREQSSLLAMLAATYRRAGRPADGIEACRRAAAIDEWEEGGEGFFHDLQELSEMARLTGNLHVAEQSVRRLLAQEPDNGRREAHSLQLLGEVLVCRGVRSAEQTLLRAARLFARTEDAAGAARNAASRAQLALWLGNTEGAQSLAEEAWEAAARAGEAEAIRAARLQGASALALNRPVPAGDRFHHALQRARSACVVEEELAALIGLADLCRAKTEYHDALTHLEQVWDFAERGPYRTLHADALLVLARIEEEMGHNEAATAAARRAYTLAWCDGPPYAYHWGLWAARQRLLAVDAQEPGLPPFDPAANAPHWRYA